VKRLVAVETTCGVTGVALFEDGVMRATIERQERGDVVLVLIDELLTAHGLQARDIERWAVDVGPGSFTGVRVGVATIKGLAFATRAEVVGVSAFDAVGEGPVILEAGKGEVYYRIGDEMGHAPEGAVRAKLGGRSVIGPGVMPRAEGVGRAALARAPSDIDRLEPLYVRAPDLTKPSR
jgi:tRNA A37 threonylcarbamoyladenosine modification protein TsaB